MHRWFPTIVVCIGFYLWWGVWRAVRDGKTGPITSLGVGGGSFPRAERAKNPFYFWFVIVSWIIVGSVLVVWGVAGCPPWLAALRGKPIQPPFRIRLWTR
jgi:hypothetical protein